MTTIRFDQVKRQLFWRALWALGLSVLLAGASLAAPGETYISAGGNHTCAIETDGDVVCWGRASGGPFFSPARPSWDDLEGQGGQDTLHGEGGLDVLLGGADNDLLLGGDDPDALFGQNGDDALDGGLADDYCRGGRGADTITNCEGASSAGTTADEALDVDEEAARRSNDGAEGENAIEQRIQQVFLPLVNNE